MIRQPSEVYRPRIPPKYARQVDEPEWMRKGYVIHLPMQENAGSNTYDSSRYGNDGALTGCKWVENGIEFNGSSDYIDCGNDVSKDIADAITISLWLNPHILKDFNYIISNGKDYNNVEGYNLYGTAAGEIRLRIGVTGIDNTKVEVTTGSILQTMTWQHIVCTYSTVDGAIVYYNGNNVASAAPNGTIKYPISRSLTIGRYSLYTYFFNGSIDQVRIQNRALSAAEIEAMYYASYHTYNSMRMRSVCASPVFMRRNPTMSGGMA